MSNEPSGAPLDPQVLATAIREQVLDSQQLADRIDERSAAKVEEQVEAQMASKVEELEGSIMALRDQVAEGPPQPGQARLPVDLVSALAQPLGRAMQAADWKAANDPRVYNGAAVGAQADYAEQFANLGDFVKAVDTMGQPGPTDPRLRFRADLTGEEVELGGALVPEELRAQLQMLALEDSNIRSRAMVVPMGSATVALPYIREETHSGGSTYGGLTGYWPEAGDAIGESEPSFAQATLTAKQLAILTTVNNTLIADSAVTLQALLGMLFANTTTWTEERAFIKGSGAGEPLGVINAPATINETTADEPSLSDFGDMLGRFLPSANGMWMMHPYLRGHLITLETSAGGTAFLPSLAAGIPDTFLGMPCVFTEHLAQPASGAASVLLADWRYYLIGDRQAMSMATSEHSKFANNQTQFRSVARVDGQPWLDTSLTLDGGGSVSPFVRNS